MRHQGGREQRLAIRERFEVAVLPNIWGQQPFLAIADSKDSLISRHEGPWDQAGRRQAESVLGTADSYFLWAWANEGAATIESITVEPVGCKFVLAAITLSHLDEHPLRKAAKREVMITLPDEQDASRPFDLEVEVDRGVATFAHPLPTEPAQQFIDDRRGWGQRRNERSTPAYVEIAARPSATVTVKSHGQELGHTNWGEIEKQGEACTPRVHFKLLDRGRNWVHVTVVDDETDKPIACRIHLRSPEGIPFQPHGHHNHVNRDLNSWHQDVGGDAKMGQVSYAYIDGRCQGWLPRGDVIVDVARGFEYEPLRAQVQIKGGQRDLKLRLKRWTHMNAKRWFS